MRRGAGEFMAFGEADLNRYLEEQSRIWQGRVLAEPASYLLGINEEDYVGHLVSEYSIEVPALAFESTSVSVGERKVRAEEYPSTFSVRSGETYTRNVYVYHIPFTGDPALFKLQPSHFFTWHVPVTVVGTSLCFEVGMFSESAEQINRDADEALRHLRQYYSYFKGDMDGYNGTLEFEIRRYVESRKRHFTHQNQLLAQLKVPVKKETNVPETFAIPASRRPAKIALPRPAVLEPGYQPEPTLDDATYRAILEIVHDAGQNLERLPSTYAGKGEEALRDHFIILLEPHFRLDGSVTGETFNKAGKTDILIRYQNRNAFAAECKFWKGQSAYLKTIDQLLSYLTWRDSKAAVIVFDRNRDLTADLNTIREVTPDHACYLSLVGQPSESWFDYRFHLPGDRNRVVEVAVMAFHFPPPSKQTANADA